MHNRLPFNHISYIIHNKQAQYFATNFLKYGHDYWNPNNLQFDNTNSNSWFNISKSTNRKN